MKTLEQLHTDWETTLFDAQEKFGWSPYFVGQAVEILHPNWEFYQNAPQHEGYDHCRTIENRKLKQRCRIDTDVRYATWKEKFLLNISKEIRILDLIQCHNYKVTLNGDYFPGVAGTHKNCLPLAGLTCIEYFGLPKTEAATERLRLYSVTTILRLPVWCWPIISTNTLRRWMKTRKDRNLMTIRSLLEAADLVEIMSKPTIFKNARFFSELGFTRENCIFIDIAAAYRVL